ncbi:MoxR family ATPase [Alishewanella sp. 16-MA]|uniref:MoxR family ATPase n=1 Tax=Alishewanella maricola TaxID=2795740 RepID=A0ABS8C3J5_9ALTE|nr:MULTISPECIES: MoxR family ATPase [Alishewanella]MCC5451156.1 MoxR family ATPase [Rheinheimera sp. UJ51]MCF4010095.1 MoxR family ATPase [Rheinheimera sp. UJ63]MDP5036088.1 MoxR family ATPase [Alishewanella sp.]MDP5207865.1 MoxR family ATPase [Alishewanella sp. SMS9]MCB5226753.1 MoxR family ATPase [Alishewanella maricola]
MVQAFASLKSYLDSQVLGQPALTEGILLALLANGHLLVEGPPGLAKTRAVNALAQGVEAEFHRIQFTPDLLPADLTGTDIYRPETGQFAFQSGPLFHNIILADEINRAPAKVQSALLEAMAEKQVTVGRNTYPLPELFLVMATQNPLEQEGTYPLPEAQLDRFLLHLKVDYPDSQTELAILRLTRAEARHEAAAAAKPISQAEIFAARQAILKLHLSESLEHYMVQLIMASRQPAAYSSKLASWIGYGASPRATIALDRCARARAWLQERDFVTPEDIQAVFHNVMRHRLILTYAAEAEGISTDHVLDEILQQVAVP